MHCPQIRHHPTHLVADDNLPSGPALWFLMRSVIEQAGRINPAERIASDIQVHVLSTLDPDRVPLHEPPYRRVIVPRAVVQPTQVPDRVGISVMQPAFPS